jgi:hypothetical protein
MGAVKNPPENFRHFPHKTTFSCKTNGCKNNEQRQKSTKTTSPYSVSSFGILFDYQCFQTAPIDL